MLRKLSVFVVISWIIGILVAYYFILPPINVTSFGFWAFFGVALFMPLFLVGQATSLKPKFNKNITFLPLAIMIVAIVAIFGGMLIASPVFNAQNYTKRITVVPSSFKEDIKTVDFNNLPLLDKASAQKVGDRVVGQIPDLVSQFRVSDEYSLINYNDRIVRVTPLEHNGLFKYFGNLNGTAGYVIVDTTTGEATLVRMKDGLKYLPSAYFFNNLRRHVQINNPFDILGETSFELDENGQPFWIIQTLRYTWINMKKEIKGVIAVNAISGEMTKYDTTGEIPKWIDNVYDANLVMEEIDSWGMYQGGFLNSMFSQKNVIQTTEGYTYMTANDDVYMYTGITSVSNDESNIGFVMVNLRTHEARFYSVPGAEEYGAMDSAVGAVQEKNYTSTFPLLINLNGRATYLMSLKDGAGLVKMYAFVDVENYQKVSVSDSSLGIEAAARTYLAMMGTAGYEGEQIMTKTFVIDIIKDVVVNGNTSYYLLSTDKERFVVSASVDLTLIPFLKPQDMVTCTYYPSASGLNSIKTIVLKEETPNPVVE